MLAGLPKAPSAYNPVTNPKRAKTRQLYVLRRMHDLKFITDTQFQEAQTAPLDRPAGTSARRSRRAPSSSPKWRGRSCSTPTATTPTPRGSTVWTTVRKADQDAAYAAVRRGVIDYDRRHGYRGPEGYFDLPRRPGRAGSRWKTRLPGRGRQRQPGPAVVLEASPNEVKAVLADGEAVEVTGDGLKFAARSLGDKAPPATAIRRGAVIRLTRDDKVRWTIAQLPQAEAALVAIDPNDGAIRALVGGFDFDRNKFNHVTQAQRQPGSSFKPFIYSAALEKGFTPATVINDAPFFVPGDKAGGEDWEPKNYDGKFDGPMRCATRSPSPRTW